MQIPTLQILSRLPRCCLCVPAHSRTRFGVQLSWCLLIDFSSPVFNFNLYRVVSTYFEKHWSENRRCWLEESRDWLRKLRVHDFRDLLVAHLVLTRYWELWEPAITIRRTFGRLRGHDIFLHFERDCWEQTSAARVRWLKWFFNCYFRHLQDSIALSKRCPQRKTLHR